MILERFPELQALSDEEKLLLIDELDANLNDPGQVTSSESPEFVKGLQETVKDYMANPSTGLSWQEVKQHARESRSADQ